MRQWHAGSRRWWCCLSGPFLKVSLKPDQIDGGKKLAEGGPFGLDDMARARELEEPSPLLIVKVSGDNPRRVVGILLGLGAHQIEQFAFKLADGRFLGQLGNLLLACASQTDLLAPKVDDLDIGDVEARHGQHGNLSIVSVFVLNSKGGGTHPRGGGGAPVSGGLVSRLWSLFWNGRDGDGLFRTGSGEEQKAKGDSPGVMIDVPSI